MFKKLKQWLIKLYYYDTLRPSRNRQWQQAEQEAQARQVTRRTRNVPSSHIPEREEVLPRRVIKKSESVEISRLQDCLEQLDQHKKMFRQELEAFATIKVARFPNRKPAWVGTDVPELVMRLLSRRGETASLVARELGEMFSDKFLSELKNYQLEGV